MAKEKSIFYVVIFSIGGLITTMITLLILWYLQVMSVGWMIGLGIVVICVFLIGMAIYLVSTVLDTREKPSRKSLKGFFPINEAREHIRKHFSRFGINLQFMQRRNYFETIINEKSGKEGRIFFLNPVSGYDRFYIALRLDDISAISFRKNPQTQQEIQKKVDDVASCPVNEDITTILRQNPLTGSVETEIKRTQPKPEPKPEPEPELGEKEENKEEAKN